MTEYKELTNIYFGVNDSLTDSIAMLPKTDDVEAMALSYMVMNRKELVDMGDCIDTLDTIIINAKNILKNATAQYKFLKELHDDYKSMDEL